MIRHRILFVCTGNICRSPTAEGVVRSIAVRQKVDSFFSFDSAGTQAYHVGETPDLRTLAAASRRGYELSNLRARRVVSADFSVFDYILAMDRSHLEWLQRQCPAVDRHKLGLLMAYAEHFDEDEVPDPYYGSAKDFERVLDLVEDAGWGLINGLAEKWPKRN